MRFHFLRGPTSGHLDVSRMLWFAGGISAILFTGAHLYLNHVFSILDFGGGMGLICAGGGGATAVKDAAVAKAVASGAGDGGWQ